MKSIGNPEPRRSKKRLAMAVIGAVSVLGAGWINAPAAHAAGCYGDYCSGKDPEAMGCSADAYTTASARIPGTSSYVELRWSPSCKTNWARAASNWGNSGLHAVQCATGYTQAGVSGGNGSFQWTRMIYSPNLGVSARRSGAPGPTATGCA